jgi:O-antigen/teichoic acid export membrane protein
VPGLVLSLAVLGSSLQAPNFIYYRNLNYFRQRVLQSIEPLTAFTITIGLAIAGFGYWSLVIGAVVGSFLGAAGALAVCPYRIRLRFKRETLSEYFSFSWPLVLSRGELIIVAQASLLIATWTSGLAAAGAITFATAITQFTQGVDHIVTRTIYPAVCAVRERSALLFEVFVKSNRLALMWGMPFGFGLALFAPDLVHFVIGDKWEDAIIVMQALGLAAGIDQLGFNWTAFMRALGITRPMAILSVFDFFVFLGVTTPLLVIFGLPGFAAGVLVAEAVRLTARSYYLKRLFPQLAVVRYFVRAITPVLPAVFIVLGARLLETGDRTPALAAAELTAFVLAAIGATLVLERRLLRESLGYLKRKAPKPAGASLTSPAR